MASTSYPSTAPKKPAQLKVEMLLSRTAEWLTTLQITTRCGVKAGILAIMWKEGLLEKRPDPSGGHVTMWRRMPS